jgi:hypothetical protein
MTASVETALTLAAISRLIANPGFAALLGTDVGTDVTHGKAYPDQIYADGWVFVGQGQDGRPVRDPTGTGTSAVTMDMYGAPWGPPNNYNTAQFPVLRVITWSDPTRADPSTGGSLVAVHDAEDRCNRVRKAIIDTFHDPLNIVHAWGSTQVISCVLGSKLALRDVYPYDGLVAGELRFFLEA